MGQPKLLLSWDQSTILERTLDNLLNSKIAEVIVVLGPEIKKMTHLIANRQPSVVVNSNYRKGMSTSIIAGLGLISDQSEGIMLTLADQPFVDSLTINHLIEAFGTNKKGITIPVYQGRRGHPVIFATRYKDELLRLKGDTGGREIIDRHPEDVLEVSVNCEGVCLDIDTPVGYYLERNKSRCKHPGG